MTHVPSLLSWQWLPPLTMAQNDDVALAGVGGDGDGGGGDGDGGGGGAGTTHLVCSGVWQAVPLLMMLPWQQLRAPPGRLLQPLPPHEPQLLGQHARPLGERIPEVHMGGEGAGAAGGDGGMRRAYMVKPACASLAEDGQPMHTIAFSPLA